MNVIIYTTPTCGYCKQAKAFFDEHNVEYAEIDVAADREKAQDMVERSGQMGVPVIEIDGEMILGFDRAKLMEKLGIE